MPFYKRASILLRERLCDRLYSMGLIMRILKTKGVFRPTFGGPLGTPWHSIFLKEVAYHRSFLVIHLLEWHFLALHLVVHFWASYNGVLTERHGRTSALHWRIFPLTACLFLRTFAFVYLWKRIVYLEGENVSDATPCHSIKDPGALPLK